jgi:hypothetical protein
MAVLKPRRSTVAAAAAFTVGAVLSAVLTSALVAPRPGDLVSVDEQRGRIGVVAADRSAFVLDRTGSFRVFSTEGLANVRTGERVIVGLLHVRDFDDVVLFVRPQG